MYITIPHKKGVVNDLDTTDGVQREKGVHTHPLILIN